MKSDQLGNAPGALESKPSQVPRLLIGLALIFTEQSRSLARRALTGLPKVIALDIPLSGKVVAYA